MTSWDSTQPIVEALQDQGLSNSFELEFATEEQFAGWLNQMQPQQAGTSSDSQMGTFDGETWTPNQAAACGQTDMGASSPSQAPSQYAIKAAVCLHHIYYSDQLPWSGTQLDFDKRYCDDCLERQGLAKGIADIDLNADLERQRLAQGVADIDLNGDLSFLNIISLDVGSSAEFPFTGYMSQVSSEAEAMGENLSRSFAAPSLMELTSQDPLACEGMQEMSSHSLKAPVPLMGDTDQRSSVGPVAQAFPSFLDLTQQIDLDQESDFDEEEEHCEPETRLSFPGYQMTESDNTEDMAQYEDQDMEDAFDEPPSPEIGVSFSPEHIWPGEDIAKEEPGYSSDYRFLDD